MISRRWVGALANAAAALLAGGLCYALWLAAFLIVRTLASTFVTLALWLLAPIVTAAGFAAGVMISESCRRMETSPFMRLYLWTFIGCAIGAGSVYWYGPMLIVFGMLGAGTLSVLLREAVLRLREGNGT